MSELNIDVPQLIEQINQQLQSRSIFTSPPKMIGIRTGGEWIAQALHEKMQLPDELGVIDIAFYRDDFSKKGLSPSVAPSHIPWPVDDQHIILVDDVLYTGRTTRAALNEIFDFGRPASVTLVTLIDRLGGRELPFQADIIGATVESSQAIKLSGPEPLTVSLIENSEESA